MLAFLLDENIGCKVYRNLKEHGIDVVEVPRGSTDEEVLELASKRNRILITLDRDFGRLVHYELKAHVGVVYLRLKQESVDSITEVIRSAVEIHGAKLANHFVVITETTIRIK